MPSRNLQLIASKMKDTLWPIFRQYARVCLLCQIYVCAPRSRELFQIPLICLLLILRKKCAVRRILSHVILMFKDSHRLFVEMVIALLISPIFLKQPNSMLEWNIGKNCVLNSGVLIAVRTASIKVFWGLITVSSGLFSILSFRNGGKQARRLITSNSRLILMLVLVEEINQLWSLNCLTALNSKCRYAEQPIGDHVFSHFSIFAFYDDFLPL